MRCACIGSKLRQNRHTSQPAQLEAVVGDRHALAAGRKVERVERLQVRDEAQPAARRAADGRVERRQNLLIRRDRREIPRRPATAGARG